MSTLKVPSFIKSINDDYKAQVSHLFLLHGNIYDYISNNGTDASMKDVLTASFDDLVTGSSVSQVSTKEEIGLTDQTTTSKVRIIAYFDISSGLKFPVESSLNLWKQAIESQFPGIEETMPYIYKPSNIPQLINVLNLWFGISKTMLINNYMDKASTAKELLLTLVLTDADTICPAGDLSNRESDRAITVALRNWATDKFIGSRNKIILMSKHLDDIHESIRVDLAVSCLVKKPNLEDRLEWVENFDKRVQAKYKDSGNPFKVGTYNVQQINYSKDFDATQFAIQSAGMNRQQMKDVIMNSWMTNEPVDYIKVKQRKQRALEDEYMGMLDFKEPEFGFEQIGGHEHFKEYCLRKIITPMLTGNKKTCSRGVLLTGSPGSGKSFLAWALSKEAKMNFLTVDLGKVFGSLVGSSEANMRRMLEGIEAASPCIVFIDEIESTLSSGRQSAGDGGTSARVFNSFMSWMSDPSRTGKIVVLAASNRPDLLDPALIRSGRFDAKIAILPPALGDAVGRKKILTALKKKHKVDFNSELKPTENNVNTGIGRLLHDEKRIWSGAEIEVLMKEALDNAVYSNRKLKNGNMDESIHLEDWNTAMDNIIPNTGQVMRMIKLALLFCDNLAYTPKEWVHVAKDKEALRLDLKISDDQ